MCTVTWLHHENGYELFCNRDERHTRAVAQPPRLRERDGVKFIAPTDGDHGGSWVGVNEFGLTFSLLNRYQDTALSNSKALSNNTALSNSEALGNKEVAPREFISRGLLLLDLLVHRSQSEVIARMKETDLTRFQPFTLVALAAKSSVMIADWNGITLTLDADGERRMPLTSSSFETERVIAARQQQFSEWHSSGKQFDSSLLREFHRSHQPTRSAYSVCMHRDDAQTVSFSHIRVNGTDVRFDYEPDAPCSYLPETRASHSLQFNRRSF